MALSSKLIPTQTVHLKIQFTAVCCRDLPETDSPTNRLHQRQMTARRRRLLWGSLGIALVVISIWGIVQKSKSTSISPRNPIETARREPDHRPPIQLNKDASLASERAPAESDPRDSDKSFSLGVTDKRRSD